MLAAPDCYDKEGFNRRVFSLFMYMVFLGVFASWRLMIFADEMFGTLE